VLPEPTTKKPKGKLQDSMTLTRLVMPGTLCSLPLFVKNNKRDSHANFISYGLSIELGP
jgi:hypothetical protein